MLRFLRLYILGFVALCGCGSLSANGEEEFWNHVKKVVIVTENGIWPTAERLDPPGGGSGYTITNNDYVRGRMYITLGKDSVCYDSGELGMKFRVRGNTSGLSIRQSYKIKLEKKSNLNSFSHKDKEWNIMTTHRGLLNFAVGKFIGEKLGMEWQPEYTFVHFFINGVYRGLYIITETVKDDKNRINISSDGYIVENDNYYWAEELSFRTLRQNPALGYTFKYPKAENISPSLLDSVRRDLTAYEDAVFNFSDLSEMVDLETLVAWNMAHDLLGTKDALGSNMYAYKYSTKDDSKLKFGPLWDFDTIFGVEQWSGQRNTNVWYSKTLSLHPQFNLAYREKWKQTEPTLYEEVSAFLDNILVNGGEHLNASQLYSLPDSKDLCESAAFVREWFRKKIDFINSEIENMPCVEKVEYFTLSGVRVRLSPSLAPGLYIRVTTDSLGHKTAKLQYVMQN